MRTSAISARPWKQSGPACSMRFERKPGGAAMELSITHPNEDASQGVRVESGMWAPGLPQALALLGVPIGLLVVVSLQFLVELTPWAMATLTLCVVLLGVSAFVLATLGPPALVSLEVDAVAQECEVRVGATAWLSAQGIRFSPPQVDAVSVEFDGIRGQRGGSAATTRVS